MGLSEINSKYHDYINNKSKKNHLISNVFFLSYGSEYDLIDKDLFKFFNLRKIIEDKESRDVFFDDDLINLIKGVFNSSCEKISVIPNVNLRTCKSINVVVNKNIYFEAVDQYGRRTGAVLISGLSGNIFESLEKNSFSKIVYNDLSSPASHMSIKTIHSTDKGCDFDITRLGPKHRSYSLKVSIISNGEFYEKKLITGTIDFCKKAISKKGKELLSKSFLKRGAFMKSLIVEPECSVGFDIDV